MKSLRGTHPDVVGRATVGRRLNAQTQLQHMILVLDPSDDQKIALDSLLDAQQDKNSGSFHKWLTPDTFAENFGVAPADIAQVSAWMNDNGLQVESVSRSHRFITFSGTVGSVETAFNTEMHTVTVDGEEHISNTTDLSVPAALAPVVKGMARLNNFFPKAGASHLQQVTMPATPLNSVELSQPEVTTSGSTHYVAPPDLATIYNATPLTQAGIDGTGITVAVLARSNILLSDVTTFRSLFGLKTNNPNVIVVGSDPGTNSDEIEAVLDAEMAGALAPGAAVDFIVSSSSLLSEGIDTAGLYAVDNNIGDIITLSYGGCETSNGASATAFWNDLWEEAAAQGQTAFVASGDSGAAGCASSSAKSAAATTVGVNALGSSPYNVAVGGSMFVDFGPTQYWNTNSTTVTPYGSANSYVPEAAWNEGLLTTTDLNSTATAYVSGTGIIATGGGDSIYTARPSWQTGSGISATTDPTPIASGSPITGLHRLVPDIAFVANTTHDATVFCLNGDCSKNVSGGLQSFGTVGGTSVAAPAMASAQALIDAANGGRQGNANYYYYALANRQYTSSVTTCESVNGTAGSPTVILPASTCSFHDIIAGSNIVPIATTGGAGFGFSAGPGFDETTGLGSANIANLAANWSSVTFSATTTTLSLTPTTFMHGASQTVGIQVTSSTGTPTGDVSIIASSSTALSTPLTFTLVNGAVAGTLSSSPLQAGTYTVHAHYSGDGVYAPSDSAPITVTISNENSKVAVFQMDSVTSSGHVTANLGSVVFGAGEIYLDTEIASASGSGTPSGSLTYTVLRNGSPMSSLTTSLDTYGTTYLLAGPPFSAFYLLPNYATLPGGTYRVTATYAGDTTFSSSSSTINFTVTPVTSVVTYTTSTPSINIGDTATFNISIPIPTAAQGATGTVVFTDTTTSTSLGSATVVNGTATFSTTALATPGAHSISAAYSGDSSYTASTPSPVTVTVQGKAATTTTLTSTTGTVGGAPVTLTATVAPAPSGTTSTISFYDSGVLLGTGTLSSTTGIATLSVPNLIAGTHSLTASYAGDSTHSASTGSLSLVIAKDSTALAITGTTTANYGDTVTFGGDLGYGNPTGSAPAIGLTGAVSFYDGAVGPSTLLGSAAPVFGAGGNPTDYFAALNLSTLSAGTHSIIASYPGDANYAASTSAGLTLTIVKANQTIAFTGLPATATYGLAGPYTLSATASSTLGITYLVTGPATLSGTTLTVTGSGTVSVTASQTGNTNYNAATSVTQTIVVAKANQTITFPSLPATASYGSAGPYTLAATATSGFAVTYLVSGPATLSGTTLTVTGPGTIAVTASQAGDANYNAAVSVAQTIVVAKGNQTIAFPSLPTTASYGSAGPYTLAATATSGLAVTYLVSGPATLSGTILTVIGPGTVSITASQAGDTNYNAAVSVAQTIVVAKGSQTITFTDLPLTASYGSAGPYTLTATATSGLPVMYLVSGPATLLGTTLTITGPGTVSVTASQAGSTNYNAAVSVTEKVTVAKTSQTITFTDLPATATYGSAGPYTLTATSTSGLPVSYALSSGPATLSGTTLTITGAGTVSVRALQAGDSNYNAAAVVTETMVVARAPQTITFANLPTNVTYGSAGPYTLSATASSGLPVAYSISGPATLAGTTLTITGSGTVLVRASQAGSSNYAAATTITQTIIVAKTSQTITFTGLPANAMYKSAGPYTLAATASSGLAPTYVVSGPATLSGTTLTITGAGTVLVTASQMGNTNYSAATPVTQTILVAKPAQTITFTGLPANATYGSAGPYALVATTDSGLAVTYSLSGPAKLSGTTLTITGAGTVSITASQAGSTNYSPATPVTQTIVIAKADQTITFAGLPTNATYKSAGPYTLTGTSSSGLAVTYTVSGPATVSGGTTLTITGGGTVVVTASQAGNTGYNAATPVSQTINIAKLGQTITFTGLPANAVYLAAGPYTPVGASDSGLALTYTLSGPAKLAGTTVTITGAGTVSITASQVGNTNYAAATPVTQTLTVAPANQTITFTGLPTDAIYKSAGPYTLAATASSALAPTYSVSGPATLSGKILTITGAGTVVVTALQIGNINYNPATPVAQTITVASADQTITFTGLPASTSYGGSPLAYTLVGTTSSVLPVTYSVSGPATLSGTKLTISGTGTVVVTASQAGNANYNAATPVTQTISVGALSLSSASTITTQADGSYLVSTTITNSGIGIAPNVILTSAYIGNVAGTPLPQSLGSIAPGASVTTSVVVPGSAGASGSGVVLKVVGACVGGSFSSITTVTLP